MKITLRKGGIALFPNSQADIDKLEKLSDAIYEVDIKNLDMRTVKMNSAIHVWYTQISELLNKNNKKLSNEFLTVEVDYTMLLVKSIFGTLAVNYATDGRTTHTSKMLKKELEKFIDVIVLLLSRQNIVAPKFPNKKLWDEEKENQC